MVSWIKAVWICMTSVACWTGMMMDYVIMVSYMIMAMVMIPWARTGL